jgi:hypothetical protein
MTAVLDRPADATATPRARGHRTRRALLCTAAASAALLGALQLVLPAVAEQRVRSRLERFGTVSQVEVRALPAVKLLWGQADDAKVRMAKLDAGPLSLEDVSVVKHGDSLDVRGALPVSALPPGLHLRPSDLPGAHLLLDAAAGSLDVPGGKLAVRTVELESLPHRLILHTTATLG